MCIEKNVLSLSYEVEYDVCMYTYRNFPYKKKATQEQEYIIMEWKAKKRKKFWLFSTQNNMCNLWHCFSSYILLFYDQETFACANSNILGKL